MLKQGIELGEYGVRKIGVNEEKIFHAHHTAKGRYTLIAYEDGRFEYVPVKNGEP
jgi:hypothetical protein